MESYKLMTQLKHDEEKNKFYVFQNDLESYIIYQKINDSIYDFKSTFVPESLRGKGIAAQLAHYALEHAKSNDWKIKASCWYITQYIDQHPEYKSLLVS
jgi:uncharacterized protein